jgi:DNA-binding ferritin-like protein
MNRRTQSTTVVVAKMISISFVLAASLSGFPCPVMAQEADIDCKSIPKQINDLVDKVAERAESLGEVTEKAEESKLKGYEDTLKKYIEARDSYQNAIRSNKVRIDTLLSKLASCCGNNAAGTAVPPEDCKAIQKQINDLVDRVAERGESLGEVTEKAEASGQQGHEDARKKYLEARNSYQNAIRSNKLRIDSLLTKLAACCKKQQTSTPPGKPTPIFVRNYQPGEVFAGYMFLRAPGETAKNSSGFAVQMFYNFKPNLGIGGDLACAWGSGRLGTTIDVSLQRCTYTFGPQINTKPTGKVQFFFHPLIGVVHDANKTTAGTLISKSSANALALSIGVGINVHVNPRVEVRPIQVD